MPCLVAFLLVPDLIMRALFGRGAFTTADAQRRGGDARRLCDRAVAVRADAQRHRHLPGARRHRSRRSRRWRSAVAVNVALKIALMDSYAQVGLAFATSIGAWINFALLLWFAARRDLIVIDDRLKAAAGKLALAGVALAVALYLGARAIPGWLAGWPTLRDEITLALLAVLGGGGLFRHRVRAVRPAMARGAQAPRARRRRPALRGAGLISRARRARRARA